MKIYDIVEDKQIAQIEKIISEVSKKNSSNVKSLTESEIKDTISTFKRLCEEIVVQPSTILTSDGRPSSFRVVDTDTGQELSRHSGANAQGDAEADARTRTAARRPPADDRPADDNNRRRSRDSDDDEEERREKAKERAKNKVKSFYSNSRLYRWGLGLFRIIPGMWMLYSEYEEQQANAYANYELNAYGRFGTPNAQKEYKKVSGLLHTSFITEAATLAVAGMAAAGIANALITKIRRATFLIGMFGGFFGMALGFLIREAAVAGAMYVLSKQNFWETIFQTMLNWDTLMEVMVADESLTPSIAASAADAALDNRATRALGIDLDYARDMDRQRQVRDRGAASAQGTGTAGQRNQGNTGTAGGSGTAQDNRAGGSSSNQPQNRSTPQNRFTDLPAFAN